ncbi:tyrosine-type recombinase/integrase [Shinella zoogloeoides]|uniref:tyrosine-type recombinase/integrase n=1 Tax=Shinella zoogloeoides TaxID=352475 RepID=UPI00273F3B37|nr:tyrosine-type recombinase/integrase [Shinella zoogloeoides]WLR92199.1 tyrosine-type recombinase/integrase [Shinella zoogloeoides]
MAAKNSRTFADAAESFIQHGGDGRYLPLIISHFGKRPLGKIYPFDVHEMAACLYPSQKNSTRNRQAISPAKAVLRHAADRGWCPSRPIRRLKEEAPKRKSPASQTWLHAFVRQCQKDGLPHLAALVLFMATTAARVTEAINLRWNEVDLARCSALLLKTKTGRNSRRDFSKEVSARLAEIRGDAGLNDKVFGYSGRQAVNARIRAVCERAGISYKSSHACGRHTFATTAISLGIDIRTTMMAGDWRSVEVFLGTYVHANPNAGRIVADTLGRYQFDPDL